MKGMKGKNAMNLHTGLEADGKELYRNPREKTRILSPLVFGVVLALVVAMIWAHLAASIHHAETMDRIRQIHMYAAFYEQATICEGGSCPLVAQDRADGVAGFVLTPEMLALAGFRSAAVLLPWLSETPITGAEALGEVGTFIVRYDGSSETARSVFLYEDSLWNERVKIYEYLRKGIFISIISIIIISLGPIAVLLLSMVRRKGEIARFSDSDPQSPLTRLHASSMKSVIGDSGIPVAIIDSEGRLQEVSESAIAMLELNREELPAGLSSVIALPVSFRDRCLREQVGIREKVSLTTCAGSSQLVEAVFQPVFSGDEYLGGVLFLLTGQGAEKPADRLAGEGDIIQEHEVLTGMVRGLAHDLNNRVAGIVGAASLGVREAVVDWELAGRFRDILREAGKLSDVCSELLLLLTNPGNESGIFDPTHELARICQVLRSVMPFSVSVETAGVSRYKIMADRGLLRQFFFSLAMASSEQMKGGAGRVRINLSDRLPRQILSTDIETGCRTCFRYSDGFIMAPEIRDVFSSRDYEPADVDRRFGAAYGTAYRASLEFGGWISFERGMGETVLCLVLKGVPPQNGSEPAPDPMLAGEHGLRVLLADDVDLVRETLGEFLRSQDFHVSTASNGDEAMEELSRGVFDVIVLDLNMPGTPSVTIATHCLRSFPGMAVILSSGYEKPEGINTLMAVDSVAFLPKPSPPGELVRLIHSMVVRLRRHRDDSGS